MANIGDEIRRVTYSNDRSSGDVEADAAYASGLKRYPALTLREVHDF